MTDREAELNHSHLWNVNRASNMVQWQRMRHEKNKNKIIVHAACFCKFYIIFSLCYFSRSIPIQFLFEILFFFVFRDFGVQSRQRSKKKNNWMWCGNTHIYERELFHEWILTWSDRALADKMCDFKNTKYAYCVAFSPHPHRHHISFV